MAPIPNSTLELEFPSGWSDHPPPPRLSGDEYADWIERRLDWLPKRPEAALPGELDPGPSKDLFEL